ncbi:restriction endonuclease subunit S, partial [Vibrio cholerae]|uniref:restriction endonuclease subunit S n=1 Tax=Vibrio cholerae TaxID=666 RepID=UPI00227101C3
WDVQTGRELFSKIQDGTHFSPKIRGGEFLYVTSKNIKFGYLDLDSAEYIDRAQHESIYKRCDVRKNDILLTKDGANTGNAALNFLDEPFSLLSSVAFLRLDNEKHSPSFFLQQFLSSEFQSYIQEEMSGNAITRLTLQKINNLKFYVPSWQEQTAIANALSDVDALISELEKLIAKKQAIKTATMQQLLTGRTRLPQFALRADGTPKGTKPSEVGEIPEDWEVVTLGDIGQTVIGLTYSPNDVADFGTLVLRSSNVQNGKLAYADNVYVNMELPERVIVKQGDILICVRNGSRQLIGKCALIDENAEGSAFGAFMSIFRTKYSVFVFYQFQSDLIQNQINEIMGATINQITNKDMSRFKITLPSDEKEQTDIATILSDMDAEIQALEQRLGKTRHIKQGMMQELLTGKTRLVQPSLTGVCHAD